MGIFEGIGDMFTGGGGDPGFEGLTDWQRGQMIKYQMGNQAGATNALNQAQWQQDQRWKAQQATLPMLWQSLGLTPQTDANGNLAYINSNGATLQDTFGPNAQLQSHLNARDATNANAMLGTVAQQYGFSPSYDATGNFSLGGSNAAAGAIADRRASYMDSGAPTQLNPYQAAGYAWTDYNPAQANTFQHDYEALGNQAGAQGQLTAGFNDPISRLNSNYDMARGLVNPELQRLGMYVDPATGQWTNDPNSGDAKARTLGSLFLDRAQQGMQGNLPVDPGLQRQLDTEEKALRSKLQASLGADYATSTPGMAALADFSKRRTEVLYNQQQDAMNLGVQNYGALNQQNLATLAGLYGIMDPSSRIAGQIGDTRAQQANSAALVTDTLARQGALGQANANFREGQAQYAAENMRNQSQFASQFMADQSKFASQDALARAQYASDQRNRQAAIDLGYSQLENQIRNDSLANIFGAMQNARQGTATLSPWSQYEMTAPDRQLSRAGTTLDNLYQGMGFATKDPGTFQTAALLGQLGSQSTALPWAGADWEGMKNSEATNINNIWWRNFMASAGKSTGNTAGVAAGAGLG